MHFINPFKGLRPKNEKASSVSIPSTDHLSEEVITSHKKKNPWSYLNIFNPDNSNKKSENDINIKQIKTNTLVVTGRDDIGSKPKMSEEISKVIQGSKFKIIEHGRHLCNIECEENFNITIREFIDNNKNA